MEWWVSILSAVFAAGGAWMAVRVELSYLRRDVDRLTRRLDRLEHPGHGFRLPPWDPHE
jgi:hypothetical protein